MDSSNVFNVIPSLLNHNSGSSLPTLLLPSYQAEVKLPPSLSKMFPNSIFGGGDLTEKLNYKVVKATKNHGTAVSTLYGCALPILDDYSNCYLQHPHIPVLFTGCVR